MDEWARLVDKYANELKKYDIVCAFCGLHLSDNTVNIECHENTGGAVKGGAGGSSYGGGGRAAQ